MWFRFYIVFLAYLVYKLYLNYVKDDRWNKEDPNSKTVLYPPNVEIPQPPSKSCLKSYKQAAVCSDHGQCSHIGRKLMKQGGNAIDAVIGVLFCQGLVLMQSMGLGGGVLMTIYLSKQRKAVTIISRERAPQNISWNDVLKFQNATDFATNGLAIGVPGEVSGYHIAHKKFGTLPWATIMQPSIELCWKGYKLTKHQYDALNLNKAMILKDNLLRNMFLNPKTKTFYRQGHDIIIPSVLCQTYQTLASEGASSFYNGTLAKLLHYDLNEINSTITIEDLSTYNSIILEPIVLQLDEFNLYLTPPPGSGHVVAFIMNLLNNFKKDFQKTKSLNAFGLHYMIEALKFGFVFRTLYDAEINKEILDKIISAKYAAQFKKLLNASQTQDDPGYYGLPRNVLVPQNYGTAHVSIISPNGDAVSATSSLNYYFGIGRMGSRTGIVFNNALSDFTIPHLANYFGLPNLPKVNLLQSGKFPMSSMSPLIVTKKEIGQVHLVTGAAGGSRIISTVVQILLRTLWLNQTIKEAIDAPRFHHQLVPNILQYEFGVLQSTIDELKLKGHKTMRTQTNTVACGIEYIDNALLANSDYRKDYSNVDGF